MSTPDDSRRDPPGSGYGHVAWGGRHETPLERLDRNWASLLQELRVVQTGVQVLTGLLLTLPFQGRFEDLTSYQYGVYLVTLLASVCATVFLVAPVVMHRLLFRRGQLPRLVAAAHRFTIAGIVFLGIALTGAVVLVVGIMLGDTVAFICGAASTLLFVGAWGLYPWWFRARTRSHGPLDGF
ncbi:DUF6328 family protein [Rhodococcus coprophilus]|nr:DUF6328 family protein [Rhodococcus coprophilus]MBM7459727.1 hypothetical protein [Rhodococcus coprophilus]